MTNSGLVAASVSLLLCGALLSPAQATLFGTVASGSDTLLVTVDTSNGHATSQGSIGVPHVSGLAGVGQTLFASRGDANPNPQGGQIVTINPSISSTGTVLFPGTNSDVNGLPIGGLAFLGGTLYGTCTAFDPSRPDVLCTINTLTGRATRVSQNGLDSPNPTIEGYDGLASDGSQLYASTRATGNPASEPRLYIVDTISGIATAVATIRDSDNVKIGAGVIGLEFVDGTLYGSTDDARIITIDPATAIYTVVGPTMLGNVLGLGTLVDLPATLTPTITSTPTAPTATPTAGPCNQSAPTNPCVPGGGPAAKDCQLEWLLSPVPPPKKNLPGNQQICYEGDRRCDIDPDINNHSCTLALRLCINNTDPRLACTAFDLTSFEVKKPSAKRLKDAADAANLTALQSLGTAFGVTVVRTPVTLGQSNSRRDLCSAPVGIVVPLPQTAAGRLRRGKRALQVRAMTSLLAKDTDSLRLECRPSSCGNGIIEVDHEQCDDGNRLNGDGCDQGCQIEVAIPTATATPLPSATPSSSTTQTIAATSTPTDTPTPAAPTSTPSDTPTAGPTDTATNTPLPTNTPTVTDTPTVTATPTITDTPTVTPTPSITPTRTNTFTVTPSATPTATPVCGNGFLESGETCASCPADCVIHPCTATTTIETFAVNLNPAPGASVNGADVLVGYRSDIVSILGSGNAGSVAAAVKNRPTNITFSAFDFDYALHVVINRNAGLSAGRLFTVDFTKCQGAPNATPADFGCAVSCANQNGSVPCTCSVGTFP